MPFPRPPHLPASFGSLYFKRQVKCNNTIVLWAWTIASPKHRVLSQPIKKPIFRFLPIQNPFLMSIRPFCPFFVHFDVRNLSYFYLCTRFFRFAFLCPVRYLSVFPFLVFPCSFHVLVVEKFPRFSMSFTFD
jgi:hypothetical protein